MALSRDFKACLGRLRKGTSSTTLTVSHEESDEEKFGCRQISSNINVTL